MNTATRLIAIMSLALVLFGCSETSTTAITASEPTYDLEAIMRGFAETYRTENQILAKAIRSWDSIDDEDRRTLWSALRERMRLGDEFKAMSQAHPSWAQTSCEWFESEVEPLAYRNARLCGQLGFMYTPDGARKLLRLLYDAAGSEEAGMAFVEWKRNDAGSPNKITGWCLDLELENQ